jgi:peroxiredoxin
MRTLFCLLFLSSVCFALEPGQKAADFTLPATSGKQVNLGEFKGKNVVVVFFSTQCPYSRAFTDTISQVAKDYATKGIVFIGINSNKTEAVDEVKQFATQHFSFTVVKDSANKVADQYGAQVTPEAFLIDGSGVIRYHGAVGNSNNPTTDASQANSKELRSALDELLAGKAISKAKTKAFGCTIKRVA